MGGSIWIFFVTFYLGQLEITDLLALQMQVGGNKWRLLFGDFLRLVKSSLFLLRTTFFGLNSSLHNNQLKILAFIRAVTQFWGNFQVNTLFQKSRPLFYKRAKLDLRSIKAIYDYLKSMVLRCVFQIPPLLNEKFAIVFYSQFEKT